MKYSDLKLGTIEAVVNKLGGLEGVERFLRGEVQIHASFVTNLSRHDLEVISGKEGPQHPTGVTVADLELREFLYRDEQSINSEELRKRAFSLGGLFGLHTAEYLLQNQKEIPGSWRGRYPVFPATELRDSQGRRRVPSLYWDGERWILRFRWIEGRGRVHPSDRLVRPHWVDGSFGPLNGLVRSRV